MLVHEVYRNKNLEVIDEDMIDFAVYCQKLSSDLVHLLTDLENALESEDINNNPAYRRFRHKLFDIAGAISRLNENVITEESW